MIEIVEGHVLPVVWTRGELNFNHGYTMLSSSRFQLIYVLAWGGLDKMTLYARYSFHRLLSENTWDENVDHPRDSY